MKSPLIRSLFHLDLKLGFCQNQWPNWRTAKNMHVKMWYFLMAVQTSVGNHPIAGFADASQFGNTVNGFGKGRHFSRAGSCRKIGPIAIGALWNHQNMNRRLRVDIGKAERMFIFVNFLARNFATQDLGKNIIAIISQGYSSL